MATHGTTSFKDLGVCDVLCEACERQGWAKPTRIQEEAIPVALEGKDVIGLAETGSGKTGAFVLPILQSLLENQGRRMYALVLTPTRELALQINDHFKSLGSSIGLKTVVIVGGTDMMQQKIALAQRPHVIIATPGRLVDHLEQCQWLHLKALRYLVMDEADRILAMDFELEIDKILKVIPQQRRTYLYSATMTKKVEKLKRAALQNPVKVEVSSKYQTVDKCKQHYIFLPFKFKMVYLVHVMRELAGKSAIIFCATCAATDRIAMTLRVLGFKAKPLNGHMRQEKRLQSLEKFKETPGGILVATNVASRGLDIVNVDVVINYDMPGNSKDYIHRVGRTARAGRSGLAITLVTQYDIELIQRLEKMLGSKLPAYPTPPKDVVIQIKNQVEEAAAIARARLAEKPAEKKQKKRKRDDDDDDNDDTEESLGIRRKMKKKQRRR